RGAQERRQNRSAEVRTCSHHSSDTAAAERRRCSSHAPLVAKVTRDPAQSLWAKAHDQHVQDRLALDLRERSEQGHPVAYRGLAPPGELDARRLPVPCLTGGRPRPRVDQGGEERLKSLPPSPLSRAALGRHAAPSCPASPAARARRACTRSCEAAANTPASRG